MLSNKLTQKCLQKFVSRHQQKHKHYLFIFFFFFGGGEGFTGWGGLVTIFEILLTSIKRKCSNLLRFFFYFFIWGFCIIWNQSVGRQCRRRFRAESDILLLLLCVWNAQSLVAYIPKFFFFLSYRSLDP